MKKIAALLLAALLALMAAGCQRGGTADDAENSESVLGSQIDAAPSEPRKPAAPLPPLAPEDIRTAARLSDVPAGAGGDCARYAVCRGLLPVEENGSFDPAGQVTCAGLMDALSRLSGEDLLGEGGMAVENGGDRLVWASEGDGQRGYIPLEQRLTRAQLAQVLYRYALREGISAAGAALEDYADADAVPSEAREAMAWALEAGIFDGVVSDTLCPGLPVSRLLLAQALVALDAVEGRDRIAVRLARELDPGVPDSRSRAAHADIQAMVDSVAAKYGAVGLQVAVVEGGRVTDDFSYGWAVKNSAEMTAAHKLRVASITKVSVALAAVLLQERGVLNLDDEIGTYWGASFQNPYYPDTPVTFRTLLSHTSSIRVLEDASRSRDAIRQTLSSSSGWSNTRPGSMNAWAYNNYAFSVLGVTLELAAGESLDEVLEEGIWSALDIDAAFESGEIENTDLLAALYYYGGSLSRSADYQKGLRRGAEPGAKGSYFTGGLTISARDLAKTAALLANDGCYEGVRLLEPASVEEMETLFEDPAPGGFYQGLPLRSQFDIYGREQLYYHTGSAYGVYNCFSYDPATGDGVVVLTVGASAAQDSRGVYAVCGEISQYIYDTIGGTDQ